MIVLRLLGLDCRLCGFGMLIAAFIVFDWKWRCQMAEVLGLYCKDELDSFIAFIVKLAV